jgi:diguanylate cyclase (GGDEF)-like protein/PAS domain S-box-containing protein
MTRPRILVVEDEAVVALDIRVQLSGHGYEPVGHASRGEQAIALAGTLHPDLVLMDIRLGGAMDGIEAAGVIRARHGIPVVFLTAHAEDETIERARHVEPAGYVIKPFTERELRTAVEMALYKAKAERRLRDSEARYRQLMAELPVAVVVHAPDGAVLDANQKARALLGIDAVGLQGRTAREPGWKAFHEDGSPFPGDEHPASRALTTGRPVCQVVMGVERADVSGRVWLLVDAQPHLDAQGAVLEAVVTFVDISERKRAEAELLAREQAHGESTLHAQSILDNVVDGVITIDHLGMVQSFNKAATQIFGYAPEEAIGRKASLLMADHDRAEHDSFFQRFQAGGESSLVGQPREMEGRRKDGSLFPLKLAVSRTEQGGAWTFIGLIRDVSRQRLAEEQIRRLAFHDHLTGLPNRRLLMDRLARAMSSAGRHGQHGALMFIDLDNFKQLNDTLGHGMGDLLLRQVAVRLQACMRDADSVARLGGDEFVVLLEALATDAQEAGSQVEAVADKVLFALGQPYLLGEHRHLSTPSIGIVVFEHGSEKVDDLLRMADAAMYQAKSAGRNTARFYDPAMRAATEARARMEKDMRRGLAMNEFALFYQVQVDGDGVAVGAEALVRWQHATRGMVSPGEFIPLAEQTGMILPLGQWVLETACAQLAEWARNPAMAHWTLAVNVSASQFAHADFVGNVFRALEGAGARADRLKLELTESMLAVDIEDIIFKMFAIKSRGVSFSLDDFGTGYSSLTYLKRLPLSQLKIDQSFVRDILTDPNDAAIARTILALGHTLGLEVIAEGVETTSQHAFLAQIGCDTFQGYLFGRPAPRLDALGAPALRALCH